MTQEKAISILKDACGPDAVALGHSEGADGTCSIFWCLKGESEEDYKVLDVRV